jgi:hypothetical protein
VPSSLIMLFHLCNLGPGLFEKDWPHDNAAVLTVTFANSPSDCSKFRAAFVGIPGKCWHYPSTTPLHYPTGALPTRTTPARGGRAF